MSPLIAMDALLPSVWAPLLLALAALTLSRYWFSSRERHRLPPGPKPLPLIGNVLDMPTKNLGPSFRDLNAKYGEIVYMNVLGQPMVILGSYKAVYELLELKSSISSDRAPSPMADLTGFMWDFALEGYTSRWRTQRRAFHQLFYPNAIKNYRPTQLRQTHRLLQKIVAAPDDLTRHIQYYFGATIMGVVYGLDVAEDDDKYLKIARKAMDIFIEFMVPGRYLVESLHVLRYVPSWFPGAGFKRKAAEWRKDVLALRNVPFDAAMENTANGTGRPCIVSSLLEKQAQLDDEAAKEHEEMSRDISALAYITGADTTFSDIVAFFLAMTIYPDVQRKAQAELDAIVGPNRLPTFEDREYLPYVNALVKECLRWHVVVTLGIPHRTIADDVCNGYFIPKGTVIVTNAWGISRDPEAYPDPEEFKPERFLDPNTRDPMAYVFGNGRRICTGRHFADASLFIIVASVLHALNIEPPLDEHGKPIHVEPKVTTDMLLSYPEPFKCRITPRSVHAEALINTECLDGDD
ncbi:CyP450 monooxygenase [Trametes coccinea BRFM310]|uniref:CyP450 monooxygenase n=1 Tax=Trametes coccinea (strain BRFM310) TaxID=1353009 RepID=A0A1Y2IUU6_TRAC3|nr:CyP450 monooxygenase [Trametes coccinea BRFM310]